MYQRQHKEDHGSQGDPQSSKYCLIQLKQSDNPTPHPDEDVGLLYG